VAEVAWQLIDRLFRAGLDALSLGFGVYDRDLRLVACNRAFRELRGYPAALCETGTPIAEQIRFNAERGDYGPGEVARLVAERLERISRFEPIELEYELATGRILNIRYHPVAGGGLAVSTVDVSERRHMEMALELSEERYTLVEQAATEGIYEWDIVSSELHASPRMRRLFGFVDGQVDPRNWDWNNRVHPDDFERYKAALRRHFKDETETYECEYRIRDQAGDYRWIQDRGVCVRNEAGRAVRLIGAMTDITEHIRRETEFAEKSSILETTMETMDQGISMVDSDLQVIAFNRQFLNLLEFPPDEFKTGFHMEQAFRYNAERGEYGPGDVEEQIRERLELSRLFEPHHFERTRPDGTVIEIHGKPLAAGRGFVTTYTDITEREQAEAKAQAAQAEIERARRQLDDAIESISEGLVLFDREDRVILCNSVYRGYYADTAGEDVADMVRPGALFWDFLRAAHANGMFPNIGPDEIDAYIEWRKTRHQHSHGTIEQHISDGRWLQINEHKTADGGIASVYTDVTERKQVERELARQNARLREEIEAHGRSKATIEYLVDEIKSAYNFDEIVGESESLKALLEQVQQVARTDSTVLLLGETGTGKELLVRAIHNLSDRRERPLIKVNCAALPRDLVESELFGHERGAFTGATEQRKGRFELADGGTLFLDEAGEIPLETQAKLLRVLQEQEFERVGGSDTIRTDVRLVAATNVDLAADVEAGSFRSDLYYRLSVFPLQVPLLRERPSDIPLLAQHFLERYARKMGKRVDGIAPAFMQDLLSYPWPGNVRELENMIERATILARGPLLDGAGPLAPAGEPAAEPIAPTDAPLRTLEAVERSHIEAVLRHTGWKIEGEGGAAGILGLNPSTLRGRLRKLGIKKPG